MDYDAIIIGAGMSGLAAGIRLAQFDLRVCILERHYVCGGLNSYYAIGRRRFDVGLHAVTNFVPRHQRNTPLMKTLRQLRIPYDALDLRPQLGSEIVFPDRSLRFTNDLSVLIDEVSRTFPDQSDRFTELVDTIQAFDFTRLDVKPESARRRLREALTDPMLIDMLLCPMMYYGCAQEHDMDFTQFATLFRSIFCEGLARPLEGVRRIITPLVERYRQCGGTLRLRTGVRRLDVRDSHVASVTLDSGETLTAQTILSSIGRDETMLLRSDRPDTPPPKLERRLSFVECIWILDCAPADLGLDRSILFFNDADVFTYAVPDELIDPRSGVICCPNNFEGHEDLPEGCVRCTALASYDRWAALSKEEYKAQKARCADQLADRIERIAPGFRRHVVFTDTFTPLTIERFTGHLGGSVYGSPHKVRDGQTDLANLFLCGTDQGFWGIIGAMLSGITIANAQVLSKL